MKLLGVVLAVTSLVNASYSQKALLSSSSIDNVVKHEAGRCAMRGHCGSVRRFGDVLPCPDNDLAASPSQKLNKKLDQKLEYLKQCNDTLRVIFCMKFGPHEDLTLGLQERGVRTSGEGFTSPGLK